MENTEKKMETLMANDTVRARREAEIELTNEVEQLLKDKKNKGKLKWTGTVVDLMELLHIAFSTGIIRDKYGIGITFTRLVSDICRRLGVDKPSNPYECALRGSRRKGVKSTSFMQRYLRRRASDTGSKDSGLWENIETAEQ